MFENYHRYNCPHCQIPLIGKTLFQLCVNLNEHNDQKHPGESSGWNPTGVRCSSHYEPPEDEDIFADEPTSLPGLTLPDPSLGANWDPTFGTPMPQYTMPHGTCQNSKNPVDPSFPRLTPADLKMLKGVKVRWL